MIFAPAGCFDVLQPRSSTSCRQRDAHLIPDHEATEERRIVCGTNPTAISLFLAAVEAAMHER